MEFKIPQMKFRPVTSSMGYDLIEEYLPLVDCGLNPDDYETCTHCQMKPMVWIWDNGCFGACGCFYKNANKVTCPSMLSIERCGGDPSEYDPNGLMKPWNNFVKTRKVQDESGGEID